jgi:hypothetical protein
MERIDVTVAPAVEALLAGRYVEYLERRGDRVPAWAWTNLLAHGTEEALSRATKSGRRASWELNVWRRARAFLATEVLDAGSRAGSLLSVQAQILVPLELELISWVPTRRKCAGQWAARVLTALEDHGRVASRAA